jgi:hypothetical protein
MKPLQAQKAITQLSGTAITAVAVSMAAVGEYVGAIAFGLIAIGTYLYHYNGVRK